MAVAGMGIAGCQNQDKANQSANTDMTGSTHGGVRTGSSTVIAHLPNRRAHLARQPVVNAGTILPDSRRGAPAGPIYGTAGRMTA